MDRFVTSVVSTLYHGLKVRSRLDHWRVGSEVETIHDPLLWTIGWLDLRLRQFLSNLTAACASLWTRESGFAGAAGAT